MALGMEEATWQVTRWPLGAESGERRQRPSLTTRNWILLPTGTPWGTDSHPEPPEGAWPQMTPWICPCDTLGREPNHTLSRPVELWANPWVWSWAKCEVICYTALQNQCTVCHNPSLKMTILFYVFLWLSQLLCLQRVNFLTQELNHQSSINVFKLITKELVPKHYLSLALLMMVIWYCSQWI